MIGLPSFGRVTVRHASPGRVAIEAYSGDLEAGAVVAVLRADGHHRIPAGLCQGRDRGAQFVAECRAAGLLRIV